MRREMRTSEVRNMEESVSEAAVPQYDESNFIIIDEIDNQSGGVEGGASGAMQEIRKRSSFMEKLMGVKNSQCELFLGRMHRELDQMETKELRQLQTECTKLQHELRVLQVDQKRQELIEKRQKEPDSDLTRDENNLYKMAKFLSHVTVQPCYLDKRISHPIRKTLQSDFVSDTVKKARKLLSDQQVSKSQQTPRNVQKNQPSGSSKVRAVHFDDQDDVLPSRFDSPRRRAPCSAISSQSLPLPRPGRQPSHDLNRTAPTDDRKHDLSLPQLENRQMASSARTRKPGEIVTIFKDPQHTPAIKPPSSAKSSRHGTPRSSRGNKSQFGLTLANLKKEQINMNRRIQSFYRQLKEDQVLLDMQMKSNVVDEETEGGKEDRSFTRSMRRVRTVSQPSKARKRWQWAVDKILANLDEMLDKTYGDSYCIVLPQSMQKRLEDENPVHKKQVLPLSVAWPAPPSNSKKRANRYSATFQLQKIVNQVMKRKKIMAEKRAAKEEAVEGDNPV